ncbi:moulting cycle domain-containing protein [Ditylenchus destructor]|nr:moulting cycle domain-containing protein [Ditylenchus destructor]
MKEPPGFDKFDKIRLNEKNFEKIQNLHVNWYAFSIKALMSQLGRELYSKLSKGKLKSKSKKKALKALWAKTSESRFRRDISPAYSLLPPKRPVFAYSRYRTRDRSGKSGDEEMWQVRQSDSMPKLSGTDDKSPVARVTDLISKFTRNLYTSSSQDSGVRSQDLDDGSKEKWSQMYSKLLKIKRQNDAKKKSPGAKVYDLRMYDLVLGNDSPSISPKKKFTPEGILEAGLSLIDRMNAPENVKNRQGSNSKWLSPRFAPLMPDKTETDPSSSHLSPTIFALYETHENDSMNIASVPKMLKATGMGKRDRESVIEMLMDITGTSNHVEDALGLLANGTNFFGIDGEIFDANDRISSAYQKLENSFNVDQSNQIDNNGFAFLEESQLFDLFRDQKADIPKEALRLNDYVRLKSVEEKTESLWRRIYRIAKNIPDDIADKLDARRVARHVHHRRFRHKRRRDPRQIPEPSVLKPVVLAPYMFTPTFGLVVLGPVVLSPNLFSPLILNPSVLSPYVLSPAVGMPFILSPYVLGPYILSPLVMAPFILSPYVLSPNIINPYVLSPLILSPLVLCPDVLSPQVLGGAILSPSVASPAVLTESALMANVLSPSFLS